MSLRTPRLAPEKAAFRPALALRFLPGLYGADMPKMSYSEQLKHPNWQRKRLEVLEAADWSCERCFAENVTLHVHHRAYVKGRMAWEYENSELEALCKDCHEGEHADQETFATIGPLLTEAGHGSAERAFLAGLAIACGVADDAFARSYFMDNPDAYRMGGLLHVQRLAHPRIMTAVVMLMTVSARVRSPDALDEIYRRLGISRRTGEPSNTEMRLVEAFHEYLKELDEEFQKQKGFD